MQIQAHGAIDMKVLDFMFLSVLFNYFSICIYYVICDYELVSHVIPVLPSLRPLLFNPFLLPEVLIVLL